jgi:hypothetical protein
VAPPLPATRFLQTAQVAAGQVRHAAGLQRADRGRDGGLVAQAAGRDGDLHLVVERDEAERVARVEPRDQGRERLASGFEPFAAHRAGPVEHHLQRARRANGRAGGGSVELHEDGDLLVGLHRDQVDVERRLEVHVRSVAVASVRLTCQVSRSDRDQSERCSAPSTKTTFSASTTIG